MRCRRRCVTTAKMSTSADCFAWPSSMVSAMNVPVRPTPALQCTNSGPLAPASSVRTLRMNANNGYMSSGAPLSLHSRNCSCMTLLSVSFCTSAVHSGLGLTTKSEFTAKLSKTTIINIASHRISVSNSVFCSVEKQKEYFKVYNHSIIRRYNCNVPSSVNCCSCHAIRIIQRINLLIPIFCFLHPQSPWI